MSVEQAQWRREYHKAKDAGATDQEAHQAAWTGPDAQITKHTAGPIAA